MQPPSPFAVDLHILWEPPSDLGSMGKIDKYMIRSGKAKQLMFPLPAIFTETPMIRNVSQVYSFVHFSNENKATTGKQGSAEVMYEKSLSSLVENAFMFQS